MSIRLKLALLFTSLGAVVVLALGTLVYVGVSRVLTEEIGKRGAILIQEAAYDVAIKEAFLEKNGPKLLRRLKVSFESVDAVFLEARTVNGDLLAAVPEDRRNVSEHPAWSEILDRKGPVVTRGRAYGRPLVEISCQVTSPQKKQQGEEFLLTGSSSGNTHEHTGILRVGISLEEAALATRHIMLLVFSVVTGLFGVWLTILMFFTRKWLRQLDLILRAAAGIGESGSCGLIPVIVSDEVGKLAGGFNKMSARLEKTMVSKDFLDNILANMGDALIVADAKFRVEMVNRAALSLTGFAEADFKGRPCHEFISLAGEQNGLESSDACAGNISNADAVIKTRSGENVPVVIGLTCFVRPDGAEIKIISCKDMRERRDIEARLRQSEKLSAVGQLAAGVAHEINNPMGIILGFAQAMRSRVGPEDPLDMPVTSILREAERCKALVKSLLTFSRVSKSEERSRFYLNVAVEEALFLVLAQGRMKNITLVREFTEGLPEIEANKNQLQQIVVNLGTNAIDAMADAGKLTVRTFAGTGVRNGYAALEIRDTGHGMPPAVKKRLFEPFFTTKEVGKGTGLGLSLVHEIAQKHKALLELESEPGKGTSFTIYFPTRTNNNAAAGPGGAT